MKIFLKESVWVPASISFVCILRSSIAGSYSNSMHIFLRGHQTAFHRNCTILHSHPQGTSVPVSSLFISTYFLFVFILAILTAVKWYFIVVLIYVFLMTRYIALKDLSVLTKLWWTFQEPCWYSSITLVQIKVKKKYCIGPKRSNYMRENKAWHKHKIYQ